MLSIAVVGPMVRPKVRIALALNAGDRRSDRAEWRPPCQRACSHRPRDAAPGGGIPDFPNAKVHVHRREHDMAVTRRTPAPQGRYITDQWKHGPQWAFYGEGGEDWFGFKGVRALDDREPDILMIPLPGHTLGHCGIAVRSGDKWLLHAGDAYFFHGQIQASPKMPLVLGMFQRRADMDRAMRIENQERLRTLKANHGDAVTIFNSHDPVDYENCRCGQHREVALAGSL